MDKWEQTLEERAMIAAAAGYDRIVKEFVASERERVGINEAKQAIINALPEYNKHKLIADLVEYIRG